MANLSNLIKKAVSTQIDVRLLVLIVSLVLFVLGAGAPSAGGGLGGG